MRPTHSIFPSIPLFTVLAPFSLVLLSSPSSYAYNNVATVHVHCNCTHPATIFHISFFARNMKRLKPFLITKHFCIPQHSGFPSIQTNVVFSVLPSFPLLLNSVRAAFCGRIVIRRALALKSTAMDRSASVNQISLKSNHTDCSSLKILYHVRN